MVARICSTNPKYAAQHTLASDIVARADALRLLLLTARERDEQAFGRVVEAQALPKASDTERSARTQRLEAALFEAAAEPLACAKTALEVLTLTLEALTIPNRNLASDLGCAGEFAYAGVAACAYNVRINHRFMRDPDAIAEQELALQEYERAAIAQLAEIRRRVGEMLAR